MMTRNADLAQTVFTYPVMLVPKINATVKMEKEQQELTAPVTALQNVRHATTDFF